MLEHFNPSKSEYRKVEDLPFEHQTDFENIPESLGGGFVRKEAIKSYEYFNKLARDANDNRNIFKKIFLVDKKTFLDFARQDALDELKKEQNIDIEVEKLKSRLLSNFKELLFSRDTRRGILQLLLNDEIDLFISEDRKGRLPTEILWRFREGARKKLGYGPKTVPLIGLKASRNLSVSEIRTQLNEIIREDFKNIIYVTDFIYTEETFRKVASAFEGSLKITGKQGISIIVVPLVSRDYAHLPYLNEDKDTPREHIEKTGSEFYSISMGTGEEVPGEYLSKYSGLNDPLSNKELIAKNEIIEYVSDALIAMVD